MKYLQKVTCKWEIELEDSEKIYEEYKHTLRYKNDKIHEEEISDWLRFEERVDGIKSKDKSNIWCMLETVNDEGFKEYKKIYKRDFKKARVKEVVNKVELQDISTQDVLDKLNIKEFIELVGDKIEGVN